MTTPRQIIVPGDQGDVPPHEHDATEISGVHNFLRALKVIIQGDLSSDTWDGANQVPGSGASAGFFLDSSTGGIEAHGDTFLGGLTLLALDDTDEGGQMTYNPAGSWTAELVTDRFRDVWRVIVGLNAPLEVGDDETIIRSGGTEVARFTADGISSARGVLGYATRTSNVGTFTTETDMTDLTTTVTVPAGRVIKISAKADFFSSVSGDRIEMRLYEDATQIQRDVHQNAADAETASTFVVREPTADSHTYKVTALRANGTGNITMTAAGDRPAVLSVEDLGPA